MKKIITVTLVMFFWCLQMSAISFTDLVSMAWENNSDIQNAVNSYESYIVSSENLNGAYTPSVTVASYLDGSDSFFSDTKPDSEQAEITYTQPLPGGTTYQITGACKVSEVTIIDEKNQWIIPTTTISVSQSLLPFWVQGESIDPYKKTVQLQQQYYLYHIQAVKNTVLQNLIIQYATYNLYEKEIETYQNLISVLKKQIAAQREMQKTGKSSLVEITEMENSLWKYQQGLIEVLANRQTCFNTIQILCGTPLQQKEMCFTNELEIPCVLQINTDPVEEKYRLAVLMVEEERIYDKQNSAPVFSITARHSWTIDPGKQVSPNTWEISLGMNLSPWLNAEAKNKREVYDLEHEQAVRNLNEYLKQRECTRQRYEMILSYYQGQLENTEHLLTDAQRELEDYQELYKNGTISQIDLDSAQMNLKNLRSQIDSLHTNIWLYENLVTLNSFN